MPLTLTDPYGPDRVPRHGPILPPEEDALDPRDLLHAMWRRRWMVLAGALAGAALSWALVSLVEPRYSARASVMLDPRTMQILPTEEVLSNLTLSNPLLDSEAVVLRSNLLLEEVIAGLDDDMLAALDPGTDGPGGLSRLITAVTGAGADRPARPLVTAEEQRLRRLVVELRRSLTVWREGQSYLISIGVETADPALSSTLANGIAGAYIDRQIGARQEAVAQATAFLRTRVDDLAAQVEESEAAIEAFRTDQLARSGITAEALQQQLLDLSTQHALAQADLASARARFEQIRRTIDGEGIGAAADLLSSPLVQSLREDLSALRREDADLAARLGPDHPDRRRVAAAIALVGDDLSAEVDALVSGLRTDAEVAAIRVESLRAALNGVEARAAGISSSSLELRQLEREADAARSTYEETLTRYNETMSQDRLQRADARIVERAVVPSVPSAPRPRLFTAFGAAAGLTLGLIAAFVSFAGAPGFTRPREIESLTGVPVLAALPAQRWRSLGRMIADLRATPYQPFAERLRKLRQMIDRGRGAPRPVAVRVAAGGGRKGRVVVVTSALAGEGKTTTSVALAFVEALAGRRVAYVDFDTRRSRVVRDLDLDGDRPGLSEYLRGSWTLDDAVQRPAAAGFDVVPTVRPDPGLNDEIEEGRLAEILGELRERYDIVIVDTPPILTVTDATPLVRHADRTLLLVRAERTRKSAVREAVKLLDRLSDDLAIVVTHSDLRQERTTYGGLTHEKY